MKYFSGMVGLLIILAFKYKEFCERLARPFKWLGRLINSEAEPKVMGFSPDKNTPLKKE